MKLYMNNILEKTKRKAEEKKKQIGKSIMDELNKKGWKKVELAHKLDELNEYSDDITKETARQKVGRWTRGNSYPTLEDLCELSVVFDCDIQHLLGEFQEPTRTTHDICKITKLSEKAVTNIIKYSDFTQFGNIIEIINALLENDSYLRLLQNIMLYKDELPEIIDTSKANYKLFDLQRNFITVIDEITDVSGERERKNAFKQKRLF